MRPGLPALGALAGIGERGFAHPFAFIVRTLAGGQALAVAGAFAAHHGPELAPVDRADLGAYPAAELAGKAALRAAGIDIGARIQVAAVPPELSDDPVRTFGSFTADIEAMANWLVSVGITTVAMESTGVYWKPIWHVLAEEHQPVGHRRNQVEGELDLPVHLHRVKIGRAHV